MNYIGAFLGQNNVLLNVAHKHLEDLSASQYLVIQEYNTPGQKLLIYSEKDHNEAAARNDHCILAAGPFRWLKVEEKLSENPKTTMRNLQNFERRL